MVDDQTSAVESHSPTRSLDTTWSNLLVELFRAIVGLFAAFALSQVIANVFGWSRSGGGFAATAAVFVLLGLTALFFTSARPIQTALAAQRDDIARKEAALRTAAERHQFTADVQNGLDMAESEADAVALVGRAIGHIHDGPAELLLADSSRAHIHRAATSTAGAPGCGVPTPWSCPAVRRGQSLEFNSADALAACPRLQERQSDVSALCVPVTILGTPMGVLHATGPAGKPPPMTERYALESLAMQSGSRIGVLRAMASSEMAATTDSLTGQLNRRSVETRLRDITGDAIPFAVAYIDLDHFKQLNDTHGHAVGDQALRHFCRVISEDMREHDLLSRYGGEEFLLVFPDCDVATATPIIERIRQRLCDSFHTSTVPGFTASYGLADSTFAADAAEVISLADAALLTAKRNGRDRLSVAVVEGQGTLADTPDQHLAAERVPGSTEAMPVDVKATYLSDDNQRQLDPAPLG
jgi:diguanylate cyclase (GGDEF)-like protein